MDLRVFKEAVNQPDTELHGINFKDMDGVPTSKVDLESQLPPCKDVFFNVSICKPVFDHLKIGFEHLKSRCK